MVNCSPPHHTQHGVRLAARLTVPLLAAPMGENQRSIAECSPAPPIPEERLERSAIEGSV